MWFSLPLGWQLTCVCTLSPCQKSDQNLTLWFCRSSLSEPAISLNYWSLNMAGIQWGDKGHYKKKFKKNWNIQSQASFKCHWSHAFVTKVIITSMAFPLTKVFKHFLPTLESPCSGNSSACCIVMHTVGVNWGGAK